MMEVRIESVSDALGADAADAQAAVRLVARSAVMGFLPKDSDTRRLDAHLLEQVFRGLAEHGVSTALLATQVKTGADSWRYNLQRALEQSEHSPMPAGEWPSLLETLGEDLLNLLLGISTSSVRRYASGTRSTPQDVADRLHVLALIVADLSGAYNDYGIRRWFLRPRPQLDGQSPWEALGGGWDPDGPAAARVRDLAAALAGAAAGAS
ncbi:hypothetical protein [Vallicoccus soli]|uniref:DUF2384 domain-containing protein n=1 Tax=Vallicoccus soli TaxID=2339232 RepID=A0A3A3YWE8_9ACTN|nr:hypothetical protein [Vallicoccus soli]RJK95928.1 hypothetical protein D5H78_10040 [Vallicoccus soli]